MDLKLGSIQSFATCNTQLNGEHVAQAAAYCVPVYFRNFWQLRDIHIGLLLLREAALQTWYVQEALEHLQLQDCCNSGLGTMAIGGTFGRRPRVGCD